MKYYDLTIPPRHELGVVKEMRIATWMFPERGSEQERGAVDISCFKAKHMAFSENKVVPKTHCLSYCLFILYIYMYKWKHWAFRSSLPLFFWLWKWKFGIPQ